MGTGHSMGAGWSYPLQDTACDDIVTWLSPLSHPTTPSFLASLGGTSWINHWHTNPHVRVCIWGTWLRHPSKKFRGGVVYLECEGVLYNYTTIAVTVEEEEGGVMAKLPGSCCYGDSQAGLHHKVAFFQVWCCCGNTECKASKNTLF